MISILKDSGKFTFIAEVYLVGQMSVGYNAILDSARNCFGTEGIYRDALHVFMVAEAAIVVDTVEEPWASITSFTTEAYPFVFKTFLEVVPAISIAEAFFEVTDAFAELQVTGNTKDHTEAIILAPLTGAADCISTVTCLNLDHAFLHQEFSM